MKRFDKVFTLTLLITTMLNQNIYAYFDDNFLNNAEIVHEDKSFDKDVVWAGEYFVSVLQYIKNNYIGSDISIPDVLESSISGMTDALDDYSDYLTNEEYAEFLKQMQDNIYAVGFVYQQDEDGYPIITEILPDTPAEKDGFKVDDKILKIDNKRTKDMNVSDIITAITGNKSKELNITILRNDEEITINTKTDIIDIQTVFYSLIDEVIDIDKSVNNSKIGYIYITSISSDTADEFKKAFKQLKKQNVDRLVLDLRGNTGGVVEEAIDICKMIVPKGTIVSIRDINGKVEEKKSSLSINPFKKIVVLVDAMTASSSEIIASALQDSGSTVVGTRTYGKGVIQTVAGLPNMGVLKLTTHEYFSRNGKVINKVGITPNVEVNAVRLLDNGSHIEDDDVKTAFKYIGYKTGNRKTMLNVLLNFQKKSNLKLTNELDEDTINALNMEVYKKSLQDDRILKEGYKEIVKG